MKRIISLLCIAFSLTLSSCDSDKKSESGSVAEHTIPTSLVGITFALTSDGARSSYIGSYTYIHYYRESEAGEVLSSTRFGRFALEDGLIYRN